MELFFSNESVRPFLISAILYEFTSNEGNDYELKLCASIGYLLSFEPLNSLDNLTFDDLLKFSERRVVFKMKLLLDLC